jgi:hypothetical protein
MGERIRIILQREEKGVVLINEIFEFQPKKNKDGNFNKFTQRILMQAIDWCLAGNSAVIESVPE